MRFSLVVAVVVAGLSVSGWAQQNNTFKVKPSPPEKSKTSSVPVGKTTTPVTSATANAKALQNVEREGVRSPGSSRTAGKKTAPALKPIKDKPNPPIKFNGKGGGKSAGQTVQSPNAYKGRLKQKGGGRN